MMCKTLFLKNNMEKKHLFIGVTILSMLVCGATLICQNKDPVKVKADTTTDMDDIAVESGEQLDTANMVYDNFSSGIPTSRWVISKKAWGNNNSTNSGVIPENVFYNSSDKTVVFRALGDYYQDNDVNYKLHHHYGTASPGNTGSGKVYSNDGTRTGGCIRTTDYYGPGRFEAKFKIAPVEGVCSAFWTFNYGESGSTNYNEMDFELPTYSSDSDKTNLSFKNIICTTYKTENDYKSQHVENLLYLNDNQFHTYCLEWYWSNNTKKVKWFIDGNLIASHSNSSQISNNVGRVTIGCWIPGRESFCGIPNFDKAYMELDYFKYTPFKNQTNVNVTYADKTYSDGFVEYVSANQATVISSTPDNDFVPQGNFNYGLPSFFNTTGDIDAQQAYNHTGSGSYGIKIAGQGNEGTSSLSYTNPNIKGITKLKYSFDYKGCGSTRVRNDSSNIYSSGTLTSVDEWSTFEQEIDINDLPKTLTVIQESESKSTGLIVDNISLKFVTKTTPEPEPDPEDNSYSFFTRNNGQTTDNSSIERYFCPDSNTNHQWLTPCGKYFIKNSDMNTIYVKPNTTVMTSTSGSSYYPIKTCLINNSLADESASVACLMMLFDIADFTDIKLSMYSYSGVSDRSVYLLYSLNQGSSWSLLSSTACNTLADQGAPFRYNVNVNAPSSLKGKTIRLAFIGSLGSGEDGYRIGSVVINNFNSFKNKLDGDTCSYSSDSQALLARQYSLLSNNELNLLESEIMKHYPQTYAAGYSYLLTHWSSGSGSLHLFPIKENTTLLVVLSVAGIASILTVIGFLFLKKKKTNQ